MIKNDNNIFLVVAASVVTALLGWYLFSALIPAPIKTNTTQDTLVVGMMSGWAPFMSINSAGEYEGFDVDVAKEVARRMNKELIVEDLGSIASCFIALDQGRIDLLMSALDITEKRLEKISMIRYTGKDVKYLSLLFWNAIPDYLSRNGKSIISMESLKNVSDAVICVETGSSQEKFLDSYDFIEKKRMGSVIDSVLDIRFGKSLALLVEPSVGLKLQRQSPEIKIVSVALPHNFQIFGYGIGLKKDKKDMLVIITALISEMRTDGTLKKLEQKWQLEE